jgi:hypothetical protein
MKLKRERWIFASRRKCLHIVSYITYEGEIASRSLEGQESRKDNRNKSHDRLSAPNYNCSLITEPEGFFSAIPRTSQISKRKRDLYRTHSLPKPKETELHDIFRSLHYHYKGGLYRHVCCQLQSAGSSVPLCASLWYSAQPWRKIEKKTQVHKLDKMCTFKMKDAENQIEILQESVLYDI